MAVRVLILNCTTFLGRSRLEKLSGCFKYLDKKRKKRIFKGARFIQISDKTIPDKT